MFCACSSLQSLLGFGSNIIDMVNNYSLGFVSSGCPAMEEIRLWGVLWGSLCVFGTGCEVMEQGMGIWGGIRCYGAGCGFMGWHVGLRVHLWGHGAAYGVMRQDMGLWGWM